MLHGEHAKFLGIEAAVASDISQHLLGALPGESPDYSTYHGAKGKDVFMDGHQVDYVARGTPVGRSSCLVHGQVDRLQHITEKVVLHGRSISR